MMPRWRYDTEDGLWKMSRRKFFFLTGLGLAAASGMGQAALGLAPEQAVGGDFFVVLLDGVVVDRGLCLPGHTPLEIAARSIYGCLKPFGMDADKLIAVSKDVSPDDSSGIWVIRAEVRS